MNIRMLEIVLSAMPADKRLEAHRHMEVVAKMHDERDARRKELTATMVGRFGWRGGILCDVIHTMCFTASTAAIVLHTNGTGDDVTMPIASALADEQRKVMALFVLSMHDFPKSANINDVAVMTPEDEELSKWVYRLIDEENSATLKLLQAGKPLATIVTDFIASQRKS